MRTQYLSEIPATDVPRKASGIELSVVEDIVGLEPQLDRRGFRYARVLVQNKIPIVQARTTKGVPRRVTVRRDTRR